MRRRRRFAAPRAATVLVATVACLALAGCGGGTQPTGSVAADDTLAGVTPPESGTRPSFTLTDTNGRPYDFAARTSRRLAYLYFGYTSCDDECPTTMGDLAAALRTLDARQRAKVDVVFVTTDPVRDTRPVLRRWLDRFDARFVGLTGTTAQLATAQRAAGVPVGGPDQDGGTALGRPAASRTAGAVLTLHKGPSSGTPSPPDDDDYDVGHFSAVLTYDPDDRLRVLYPEGTSPDDLVADLPTLLEGRAS